MKREILYLNAESFTSMSACVREVLSILEGTKFCRAYVDGCGCDSCKIVIRANPKQREELESELEPIKQQMESKGGGGRMKLLADEMCPLHRSKFCCGRNLRKMKKVGKWVIVGPGVRKHIQTGLIRRSPSAMRELLVKKVMVQFGECALCHKEFEDMGEVTADHIQPRGMGAARRDDSEDNIQAVHASCNFEKGSKRA